LCFYFVCDLVDLHLLKHDFSCYSDVNLVSINLLFGFTKDVFFKKPKWWWWGWSVHRKQSVDWTSSKMSAHLHRLAKLPPHCISAQLNLVSVTSSLQSAVLSPKCQLTLTSWLSCLQIQSYLKFSSWLNCLQIHLNSPLPVSWAAPHFCTRLTFNSAEQSQEIIGQDIVRRIGCFWSIKIPWHEVTHRYSIETWVYLN